MNRRRWIVLGIIVVGLLAVILFIPLSGGDRLEPILIDTPIP